jgi:hypothetical protein
MKEPKLKVITDTKWVFNPDDDLTMKEVIEMFRIMSLSLTDDKIYETLSPALRRHFERQ